MGEVLVSPEWYRCLPKQKKTEIRHIMVDDIVSKSKKLSAKTLHLVCSTNAVSEVEVKALARYLYEKYRDVGIIEDYLNKNSKKLRSKFLGKLLACITDPDRYPTRLKNLWR